MKKTSFLLSLLLLISSCSKESDNPDVYNPSDNGVFIINEGNFGGGTGSLSFYSYKTDKVYNDLFSTINGWPLGDVAFSMNTTGQKAFIVVNNSGKIEVVDKNTLVSVSTITGLNSPRNISFPGGNKAYVTSIYSDSLAIIDLSDHSISGYININRSSESVITSGNKAFVSNWVGGNEIIVINTLDDQVIDSIEVGKEPESIVIDKNNKLWVLCNGGWARENFAELIKINTESNEIEQTFVFPSISDSPSCLQIDGQGETLYFIKNGVQKMDIGASSLPSQAFIPESGRFFYKIGINPVNDDVFITDAADYQQKGSIMKYNKDGELLLTQEADIIPAFLYFKN